MLVNKATIDAVFTNIRTEFNKIFDLRSLDWNRIATLDHLHHQRGGI